MTKLEEAARAICALLPVGPCVTDAEIAAGTHERCTAENCDAMRYAGVATDVLRKPTDQMMIAAILTEVKEPHP